MSFICNFGGLLGMWLGFSLLSISKNVYKSIRHFYTFNRNKINCINLNNIYLKYKLNKNIFKFKIKKKSIANQPVNQNNLPIVEMDL